jgi:hypothetical protein
MQPRQERNYGLKPGRKTRLSTRSKDTVACGGFNSVIDRLFRLELDGMASSGPPVVALACHQCQHISIFAAVGLGVIDY